MRRTVPQHPASDLRRNRRRFLRFLAESSYWAAMPALAWQRPDAGAPASAADALNVMEFEEAARRTIPPAHFGFLSTGIDDDVTIRANREGFRGIDLRPRRLVDVRTADLRTEIFGSVWATPIFLCPAGSQKAFHPEGELATARAARSRQTQQILATGTTTPVEEVAKALGKPPFFQLYATSRWEITEKLVKRAEAAGCPALVLTVDLPAERNTETQERFRRADTRPCQACHTEAPGAFYSRKAMFQGVDMTGATLNNPGMTWNFVDRLKKLTRMKLMIKGIQTPEDALLCLEHGADGLIVSNHGGRAEDGGRPSIECLFDVLDAVGRRTTVLVDSGFRRGTDIFKALALGARAVGVGRPYLWGLGAFGQAGVERVLEILQRELEMTMKACGTTSIAQITRSSILIRSSFR